MDAPVTVDTFIARLEAPASFTRKQQDAVALEMDKRLSAFLSGLEDDLRRQFGDVSIMRDD